MLLVHPDDESAEANAALVEQALAENVDLVSDQPLSELLPDAEVSTEGPVVVVTLPFDGAYAARPTDARATLVVPDGLEVLWSL